MQADDIRVFVPCKNYQQSQLFYQALGFEITPANNDLCIATKGATTFFLQRFFNEELANNLMLQLLVPNIKDAYNHISTIKDFNIKHTEIKKEPWGDVIYLWGPSGELWHITELKKNLAK